MKKVSTSPMPKFDLLMHVQKPTNARGELALLMQGHKCTVRSEFIYLTPVTEAPFTYLLLFYHLLIKSCRGPLMIRCATVLTASAQNDYGSSESNLILVALLLSVLFILSV